MSCLKMASQDSERKSYVELYVECYVAVFLYSYGIKLGLRILMDSELVVCLECKGLRGRLVTRQKKVEEKEYGWVP